MTTLGLAEAAVQTPKGEFSASFRSGWVKHLRVALSSAGGAAVVLAIVSLLQKQPTEAFHLLGAWGPWPVLALAALLLLGRIGASMTETLQHSFSAFVHSAQESAHASTRTAEALGHLAEQGGRQMEEMQRLAIYAAREFPAVYERFDAQDAVLKDLAVSVQRLHERWNAEAKGETDGNRG